MTLPRAPLAGVHPPHSQIAPLATPQNFSIRFCSSTPKSLCTHSSITPSHTQPLCLIPSLAFIQHSRHKSLISAIRARASQSQSHIPVTHHLNTSPCHTPSHTNKEHPPQTRPCSRSHTASSVIRHLHIKFTSRSHAHGHTPPGAEHRGASPSHTKHSAQHGHSHACIHTRCTTHTRALMSLHTARSHS